MLLKYRQNIVLCQMLFTLGINIFDFFRLRISYTSSYVIMFGYAKSLQIMKIQFMEIKTIKSNSLVFSLFNRQINLTG